MRGEIAQPVEQRPEKPCVPSSILGLATTILDAVKCVHLFIMKKYTLRNIRFPVDSEYDLHRQICKKLRLDADAFSISQILRKAVDSRKYNHPIYDFTVQIQSDIRSLEHKDLAVSIDPSIPEFPITYSSTDTPYIIGSGPAGLFCALAMVKNGLKPILFEQGDKLEDRALAVSRFWKYGDLDEDSNVQFGEGGAGAFSDGKLTSRSRDYIINMIYDYLIHFGADPVISYEALPHLGTDGIRKIVTRIRDYLVASGCKIFYRHKLETLQISEGRVSSICVNGEVHNPEILILALGNASRKSVKMLFKAGVVISPKPFSVGFRIEHKQEYLNNVIYGSNKWAQILGPASYRLVDRKSSTYSFCMCPGGDVIASASEINTNVTNGMSYKQRSGVFGNSAIVTAIDSNDYGTGIFDGMKYQQAIERKAYIKGYTAPIQSAKDYINDTRSKHIDSCSYKPAFNHRELKYFYSERVNNALKKALQNFDKVYTGFSDGGVLIASETRTSSPVRFNRDQVSLSACGVSNLFVVGEGSGYAGGIISSAADGFRIGLMIKHKRK